VSDDIESASANVSPGDKIAGYRLEEQIGQGGMAVVYRAHDERLDRRVALKVLAPGLASDTAFRTRFIRESRAAAAVDHPNIIPVYDAGDAGGFLFIAMRYVSGGDVRSLLAAGQVLSPARVWNIVNQVAAALDAAHEHDLIHRDVKPANMLVDASSGRSTGGHRNLTGDQSEHVYLSDFGISKQTLASHLTSTGQFVGTLDYIAPEQIEAQTIDGRADQYSLACATYELLTGEPPFRRDLGLALINAHLSTPPPAVAAKRPGLPPAIDQVLAKAMAKSPDQRYATCIEFATDLGKAIGTIPGIPSVAATTAQPMPGGDQAKAWPATELAAPGVLAAGAVAAEAAKPVAAAVGSEAATQYAPTPPPGLTPPPQQIPLQQIPPQQIPPQQMPPQQQTPPPQQQPGNWQAAVPSGQQPGYAPYPGQQFQQYQTGPVGPVGPPGPGWTPQSGPGWQQPPQPKKSRGPVIAAVVATVAVVAAIAAVVYFVVLPKHTNNSNNNNANSSNSSSTTPRQDSHSSTPANTTPNAPTAQSEATTVNNLLVSSAQSRSQWNANTLVTDVGNCVAIGSDITQIGDIAAERQTELAQSGRLQVGAIPNGSALKSQLMTALQISLSIDNDYLAWAKQQQSSGCSVGTGSTYYQQASNADSQATSDKETFLGTWDPIANTYGLEQFSAGQI
jgi:FlaG/FlaF family flagellin (archaellin)